MSKNHYMFPVAPPFDVAYKNEMVISAVGPHTHNAAELYFTLTDLPDVLLNDKVSAVPAGTLLIIPAFTIHQLYHENGVFYERYILTINSQWIKDVFCNGKEDSEEYSYLVNNSEPVLLFPNENLKKEFINHFQELITFKKRNTPQAMIAFFQFFSEIHKEAIKLTPKNQKSLPVSASQKKVNEMISYINAHIQENLGLSDLASQFYLNQDYLARLFKSHMHISIGHYIILQKISRAETLLREGKTVTEVQEELGYSSYAYFFKTFQKITGISPSKYRKNNSSL